MLARLLSMAPFEDGIDHMHDGGLDGFGVFNQGYGLDFGVEASLYALIMRVWK
jgi:hypothetical protein